LIHHLGLEIPLLPLPRSLTNIGAEGKQALRNGTAPVQPSRARYS
jgi:hypothetical protein